MGKLIYLKKVKLKIIWKKIKITIALINLRWYIVYVIDIDNHYQ